ncbi:RNA polymerase recycling motor ATPase HelR [Naasia aerilata]|uniref:DNA helicase n=1 Tax=Naasia aerilata TaxID=1162966 RepID=A0ABN6XKY7_9MICO|nr:RNA polymerase recycling motor ATPase HelR [Naasia aerilata]BDZ45521.1 DNA helicase [Naasia aerilata]
MPVLASAFDLPDRLAAKRDPALLASDERHFAAIAASLETSIAELSRRLAAARLAPGGRGQQAMDRDLDVHRLSARLRALRRYRLDLCLGRIVLAGEDAPVYIGRLGLSDADGRQLLVDWRTPAAEPFFGATLANPMGLVSRRRYRWTAGRISDYWDEVFTPEHLDGNPALDDESALLASLGASRSPRMRDVLSTIQADQDAIIRADSRGALVVDGGPGTGKTVVALHRAAYLLYSDPRLAPSRGGVLFVGPHEPYLSYVADVLPSLGEESVQICTLRDLVPGGRAVPGETDPEVARLKSSADLARAVENAVRSFERPPTRGMTVTTPWGDIRIGAADWAEAFAAADPALPHNDARDQVWQELIDVVTDQLDKEDEEAPPHLIGRALLRSEELRAAFARAWPLLDPVGVLRDLWTRPDLLQECAPWLSRAQVSALQRDGRDRWTVSDLPLLDAARLRVGDPEAAARRRAREAALAAEREQRDRVLDELIAADDSEMLTMSILRGQDARNSLTDEAALPGADPDLLAGPFAHILVDEAQELTDAEWGMLLRRCPSRSFTIVGDRAQARHGFAESWQARLARVGIASVTLSSLTVNYRTPEEVMAEAEPVIRAALPDANVPVSIRRSGVPVVRGATRELPGILESWLAEHEQGIACVIGDPGYAGSERVRSLTPETAKGLEFDLVVLVDPDRFGSSIEGAVDRYVSMTRATRQLVLLTSDRPS